MKTLFLTDGQTIFLEGNAEKPTDSDMERIESIITELGIKHAGEDGKIVYRTSKRTKYRKLTVQWRSKPLLVEE